AAVLAVEAPVGEMRVNAAWGEDRIVRAHRSRAEPEIPVETGLGGFLGQIAILRRTAEAGFHARDFPNDAIADEFTSDAKFARGALLRAGLKDALVLSHCI